MNFSTLSINGKNLKSLYIDGKKVWSKIPYIKRVLCLRSTGTLYIDTGIVLDKDCEVGLTVFIEPTDTNGGLMYFGTNTPNVWITSGTIRYTGSNTFNDTSRYRQLNAYNNFVLNEKSVTINGRTGLMSTGIFGSVGSQTAYIFRVNGRNGNISNNLRISEWWVKRNGNLIQNFIPVLDKNNRPAMYDEVSKSFYYNSGTGEFDYDEIT